MAATLSTLVPVTLARLRLRGLDPAAVAVLAADFGLPGAAPETIALLTERTGGNPLFVRELVRLTVAEGPAAARSAVPAGVREVLRRRAARLPDAVMTALRQAAVLGRETDIDVLAQVARRDPDELIEALEPAVLAGLLDEPGPGRVRFTHALVRDTFYEDMPLLRRSRLHARALEVLRDNAFGVAPAILARHAEAAAGPATALEAIPYVVAAARDAEAVGAFTDATRQWMAALNLYDLAERRTGSAPDRTGDLLALLIPAVTACARSGDTARARVLYLRAVPAAVATGRKDLIVSALQAWDAPMVWSARGGPPDPAILAAIDSALATGPAGAQRAGLLLARFREVESQDVAAANQAAQEALAIARQVHTQHAGPDQGSDHGAVRLLAAALNAVAFASLGPDLMHLRKPISEELREHAAAARLVDYEAVAHWLLFLEAASRTDLESALDHVAIAVAHCGNGELGSLLAILACFSGLLDLLAGRLDAGLEHYLQVARRLTEAGAMNGALMALVGKVGVALLTDDFAPLTGELEQVEQQFPGLMTPALVLALLAAGHRDEAERAWASMAPSARDFGWLGRTTFRAMAAARIGDTVQAARLFEELRPFSGRIAGLDAGTLYAGPVDDALAELAAVLRRKEDVAQHRARAAAVRMEVAAALAALGRD